jgi:hypothetical protein
MHFNLQAGLRATLAIAMVSATMSGIIGVAAYLKQSPLPADARDDDDRDAHNDRDKRDVHDNDAAGVQHASDRDDACAQHADHDARVPKPL